MWMNARHRLLFGMVLPVILALAVPAPAAAGEGHWSLRIAGVFSDAYGHDQHVLTVLEIDAALPANNGTAAYLDTDRGFGYRTELQYNRGEWGLGLDFVWFKTNQSGPTQSAAADGASGPIHQLAYEVADRGYTSAGPGEVLYYKTLEDTALAMWTVDLYGIRTLAATPKSRLHLLFGLRNADFDNDYRAIVGIEDVGGTRIDASSNYDRMIGPMLGIAAEVNLGRHRIEGCIIQALQLGSVELTGRTRDFTGPSAEYSVDYGEEPAFDAEEKIWTTMDVAIPVTEIRLSWAYRLSDAFSLGLGVNTSTWWDVPVPPGVIPMANGNAVLHESTIVFLGLAVAVDMRF